MKSMASQVRSLGILFLLGMAVWFTLPSTPTKSKYVWEDTQDITITVQDTAVGTTSLLPEEPSAELWGQDLTKIQATATADGLQLKANEGYTLPETITVTIGQQTFSVPTDGTQASEGITFNAATGLLSIPDALIQQNPGGVTVHAVAVSVSIPAEDTAAVQETPPTGGTVPSPEPPPAEETPVAEEAPPADETAGETVLPAGEPAPGESTASADKTVAAEDPLPGENTVSTASAPPEEASLAATSLPAQAPLAAGESVSPASEAGA